MRVAKDGRIAELYPRGAALPPIRESVDLGGKAVVPGFIDAHAHFMSKAALDALAVNLGRLEGEHIVPDSLEALRSDLARRAAETRGPIIGFGLCLGALAERRLPRASELDAWLPDRPIVLFSMDGHSSAYSSAALAALGLSSLAEDGVLTGEAHEFNMGKVTGYVMKGLSASVLARGLSKAVDEAARSGLVSIHCLEGTEDAKADAAVTAFDLFAGRLPLRLKLWLQYTGLERVRRHEGRLSSKRVGGCLAWEMDGSVSSRSAAFDEPYKDGRGAGRLYRTPEEAYALVSPFYRAGWQTSAHAIGPRGIESILTAYERLLGEGDDPANRLRLRIDHFEFPRPDQIERAGKLRLVLPMQPGFAWADGRFIHSYDEALSDKARAGQSPLKSLLGAGCVVALSTDAPVQPFNPFYQIAGACDHPVASERISVYEALRAYTWAGAWAAFEDGDRGTLKVGKYADFAVLEADPFETPIEKLCDIKVAATWHEGRPLVAPPGDLLPFAASLLRSRRRAV
jgi:predicted amidohydrolase YtcJ